MKNCNETQKIIANLEPNQVLEDKIVLQHLTNCQVCQDYQSTCDEMHQAMHQMSDFDADDALFESTLNSILSLQQQTKKPKGLLNTQWASALAASFMLVSLIALFPFNSISNFGLVTDDFSQIQRVSEEEKQAIKKRKAKLNSTKQEVAADYEFIDVDIEETISRKHRRIPRKPTPPKMTINQPLANAMTSSNQINSRLSSSERQEQIKQGFKDVISENDLNLSPEPLADMALEESDDEADQNNGIGELEEDKVMLDRVVTTGSHIRAADLEGVIFTHKSARTKDLDGFSSIYEKQVVDSDQKDNKDSIVEFEEEKVMLERVVTTGSRIKATDLEEPKPVYSIDREEAKKQDFNVSMDAVSDKDGVFFQTEPTPLNNKQIATRDLTKTKENTALDSRTARFRNDKPKPQSIGTSQISERKQELSQEKIAHELNPAQKYLMQMSSLDNLNFQTASGYWANTYLPGDSSMRLLKANLANNTIINLNNSISQNIQPFDYPHNAALAVYLSSDVAYVAGQQRMRIQVGIQASNRQGGQRAAMNIALVFDMNNKTPEYASKMKQLLLALLQSKQPGDEISLTVAGVAGGMLIEPKDFRHGHIQVVMNTLFANSESSVVAEQQSQTPNLLNLTQAIQQASLKLQSNDDSSATLGSSVLMLFSANNINNISEIESIVHKNAVKGITLSTVSLGKNNHQQLKKLALAGQGHARILPSWNNVNINANIDAKRVIDAELLASSRAVARALRLRIRLAKGVKLIKVIDSYNLDEKQSQRVRDAEQSLDKRLSKNLGISTDRGEDEEGIQIVIPSFFAGDTHVVLLDVVVEKAGAIADVSMRYKDLLYLRNAVSRKQLNIDSTIKSLGPLQFNVMKNVLASRFANTIKQAGTYIRNANNPQALKLLQEMQGLYQSMRIQFPVWNNDTEILQDENLLEEYIAILKAITINDVQKINYIIDSMQYISWRKQITLTQ